MIVVTVVLASARGREHDRVLGVATISNDGTSESNTRGNYDYQLSKFGGTKAGSWRRGHIPNFRRKARGPWDLLYLALKQAVGDRND